MKNKERFSAKMLYTMAQSTNERPSRSGNHVHGTVSHVPARNIFICKSASQFRLLLASLICIFVSTPTLVDGALPVTPPPRINNRPVIANGRVYFLDHIPKHCQPPIIDTFYSGKLIKDNRAMMKADNPHIINGNIEIAPSGCLYIEPGSVLKFAPGRGMIINGTLIARGSEDPGGRITMTKSSDLGLSTGEWKDDARLVLGNTTRDGRLDLKFRGKWRAICTNYNNFTAIDANVTCRHLGFLKGNFTYHSFARNLTDYILWEKPDCRGEENSLFDCPGAQDINMRTGMHICDGQEVIGFECEGLRPGLALDHWRGLDFYNSTTEERFQILENYRVYMKESVSFLEYLDISYTGLDSYHGQTPEPGIYYPKAAISASPHVPLMNNVTILYGAYDGLNLTEIAGPIHIANSTISNNRGHGMYIQTSVGRTLINSTEVSDNWGDGIKWYLSNVTIFDFRTKFPPDTSMCLRGNVKQQVYPLYEHLDLIQVNGKELDKAFVGDGCDKIYHTDDDMRITIHFLIMERDPDASGTFTLIDGGSSGRTIKTVHINNGSFPESITTETNILFLRFKFDYPRDKVCKKFPSCLRFLIELTSAYDVEEDFRLLMSSVHGNVAHGVNIHDMRSKVRISNETDISFNEFGAGVQVYRGAGQVVINGTRIEGNQGAGVNITYSGGFQILNGTELINNHGYGVITEYLRLNRTRQESQHLLEVVRCKFEHNELVGLRVGNYCRGGRVIVNESDFNFGLDEAFEYLSCNVSTSGKNTKLTMLHNHFNNNFRHAIYLRPLLNTEGSISFNHFHNHTLGVIRIDNGYDLLLDRWYREFPVQLTLEENQFRNNSGRYVVNFRLTQYSSLQKLSATYNKLQDNKIEEAFQPYLQPRSRANAVIVLSSSNVFLKRNLIDNSDSVRELATHLMDPSVVIDASENYWGRTVNYIEDYRRILEDIFDQNNRYNLAKVEYHPALRTENLRIDDSLLASGLPRYEPRFAEGNTLGGELLHDSFVANARETYYVERDIYVHPNKTLFLDRGATFKFAPSVGMIVHGLIRTGGTSNAHTVTFTLDDREEWVPLKNRTASVRLQDGDTELEGRLEVDMGDGVWGTVCNDGWIKENALLACQQLGLIYNPDTPEPQMRRPAFSNTPILMSWVSCEEVDFDLTKCKAINGDAQICDHNKDVFLKCHRPTWAGITLAAAYWHDQAQNRARVDSQLRYMDILKAGMMDPDTGTLSPALRIDYNYYQISWLKIEDSLSDGIHVFHHFPYNLNKMEYITVKNCGGNGIVTRSPRLEVIHSTVESNQKAGFLYDPFFTEYDALLVRNMIYPARRLDMFAEEQRLLRTSEPMMFLICPAGQAKEIGKEYIVEILTYPSSTRIVLQILDYLPVESVEKVTIFDSRRNLIGSPSTRKWEIEKDLVDFPILSVGSALTIKLVVNGQKSGRLAFIAVQTEAGTGPPNLSTVVTNTAFVNNDQGIVTKHYNSPSNQRLELFHRHREESISFKRVQISNSARHAMHMPSVTKFHEDYIPTYTDMTQAERLARISYSLELVEFLNNNMGLLAEHNHVDFANNVWHWSIALLTVKGTSEGGLEIEVPRVNEGESGNGAEASTSDTREVHKVKVVNSKFLNNNEFAFTVAGYYAEVTVESNEFRDNQCRMGLVSVLGMEKNLTLNSNLMTGNDGRFAVDVDINSHYEFNGNVQGTIHLNEIYSNTYTGPTPPGAAYSPKTFAVAIKGLQSMTGNRNVFDNPDLDYEFVAGVMSLTFGNPMDVQLNYWGATDELTIRRRIFDFDDWNNYVIADYFPYLTNRDFRNSDPSTGLPDKFELDSFHLGGRVDESRILAETGRPFVVVSDLTIMPGVTLTIPAGADLQFHPNIGILVLGRLIANGLPYSRIKFRPIQPSTSSSVLPRMSPLTSSSDAEAERMRRDTNINAGVRLRGAGTLFNDAGFLELYNTSTRTWNLMCDSQFNEKTAEVVCRALGMETINVQVRFTHLYDHYIFGKPMYFRKEFWFNSYHCRGDENSLRQCITRYNYNLLPCIYAANYTFITCGKRNLSPDLEYWGNIRFADDSYEEKPLEADIGKKRSSLTYVDIEGAGMLHGEKVGAIQTTYVTPEFQNINISSCVDNGYDIIAPRRNLDIELQNITGNLGFGINILVLNGESSERRSSFLPNSPNTMPYHVHGLVDMCRLEKEIQIETRALLFYKYGPQTRDCVKIIRAPGKRVGLRLLQINLLHDDFSRNSVEIFDGTFISESTRLAHVISNSTSQEIGALYRSSGEALAIHVHASVGHNSYGFIAEAVRIPLAGLTYPDNKFSHTIHHAEIRHNERGALRYKNVGETTPSLYMEHCWLADNGRPILNLTSPPTIDISLQSTISFRFSFNQVSHNSGGMYLNTHTAAMHAALRGNITNNVFAFGVNGEALNISGHYFQGLMFHQNYIYNYTAGDYRDVIHVKDVVVNLTHNYILRNVGHYILHTYNSEDGTESQLFARNGIYDNNATALRESTIKVGSGQPKFVNNYLVNNLNDFEIESYPKTRTDAGLIEARSNWWGSEREAYINGKTYDYSDDPSLTEVNFWPPIVDARSVIEGECLPGWVQDKNRCYRYMGGALPFEKAREFCKSHGAFLAEARGREGFFNYLVRIMVIERDWAQKVWVMADLGTGRCAAFEQNYIVYEEDCTRKFYPFICETDPELRPPEELTSAIKAMILGICLGVGGVILIIALIILVLWCLKSKRREKERFERTASMRSSLNNLSKINGSLRGTKSTLSMMSVGASRRRLNELDQRSMDSSFTTKHSRDSAVSNGTSVHSVHSVSSGMDIADRGHAPVTVDARATATSARGGARPKDVAPPPSRPGAGRQVHSLRPDRSAAGLRAQIQAGAGAAATLPAARDAGDNNNAGRSWVRKEQRGRDRNKQEFGNDRENQPQDVESAGEEERGKFAENSDDDSVDKEDFSDSTFDDNENDENDRGNEDDLDSKYMQYHMNRSNERLVDKPWDPTGGRKHNGPGPLPSQASVDSDTSDYLPNPSKSKSLSSFMDPASPTNIPPSKRALLPPLSSSRDRLPTPPANPNKLSSSPELNRAGAVAKGPRPAPRPKPVPPVRQAPSADRLYNNEPQLSNNGRPPFYDSVYEGSNRGAGSSHNGSHGFPHYDPAHDLSTDNSLATNNYEPVEFSPFPTSVNDPYGRDQAPDTDYMPRPLNSNLGRDRLGPPPPVPQQPSHIPSLPRAAGPQHRLPLESDIDSYMSDHGGQSLPRKHNPPSSIYSEDSKSSSRFTDLLPPKPGAPSPSLYQPSDSPAPYTPHYLPPQPQVGSRENLRGPSPQIPQPPPYSTMPSDRGDHRSRYGSRDRGLDYAGALGPQQRASPSSHYGSRGGLDELPPPYSPGDTSSLSQPRDGRGSRNDILYLGQGARPKLNESIETEI